PFECMPRPMHTSSFVICGFNLDRRFPAWQLISILRRVMLGFGLWRRSLLWARVVTIDPHRYAVNAQNRIGSAVSTLCDGLISMSRKPCHVYFVGTDCSYTTSAATSRAFSRRILKLVTS